MQRERWWAWLVPWLLGSLVGGFSGWLVDAVGDARAAGLYGLVGIGLGWSWYRLHPRPLVDRLRLTTVAVVVGSGLAVVFGGEFTRPGVTVTTWLGVLAGLVIAETPPAGGSWRRQRQTALTSRETMRDLR